MSPVWQCSVKWAVTEGVGQREEVSVFDCVSVLVAGVKASVLFCEFVWGVGQVCVISVWLWGCVFT